jgi:hypothetical protein
MPLQLFYTSIYAISSNTSPYITYILPYVLVYSRIGTWKEGKKGTAPISPIQIQISRVDEPKFLNPNLTRARKPILPAAAVVFCRR